MHLSSEAYDVFEQVFQGKGNAKVVMQALEEAIVTTVHDSWYQTKEELKAEVFSHFATKDDLGLLRIELLGKTEKDKVELLRKIEAVYEKTEKDKVELLGKIEAVYEKTEKDKVELLGKIETVYEKTEKDKVELLGKIETVYEKAEKDKVELLGKIETVYEKTEKDKAELLGTMGKNNAELLGRIDVLYQKTEKDKSDMLLRLEKIDKKFSLLFALLIFAIIFLNQNALEFLAKFIGIIK